MAGATKTTPRQQAMDFIAVYDLKDGGTYEQHMVRVARLWRSLIDAHEPVQAIVDDLLADFAEPAPDDYGCGWEELKSAFMEWAAVKEYISKTG